MPSMFQILGENLNDYCSIRIEMTFAQFQMSETIRIRERTCLSSLLRPTVYARSQFPNAAVGASIAKACSVRTADLGGKWELRWYGERRLRAHQRHSARSQRMQVQHKRPALAATRRLSCAAAPVSRRRSCVGHKPWRGNGCGAEFPTSHFGNEAAQGVPSKLWRMGQRPAWKEWLMQPAPQDPRKPVTLVSLNGWLTVTRSGAIGLRLGCCPLS